MGLAPAERRTKTGLLILVRAIPAGSVVATDVLAHHFGVPLPLIVTLLANLTVDERETSPWHRVVAKGGGIGRGPHRDAQFAKLIREGVPVSPAGIVQDMARVAVTEFDPVSPAKTNRAGMKPAAAPHSRSRGMKDRPG